MSERIPEPHKEAEMKLNWELVASMATRAKALLEHQPKALVRASAITLAMTETGIHGDREQAAYRRAVEQRWAQTEAPVSRRAPLSRITRGNPHLDKQLPRGDRDEE